MKNKLFFLTIILFTTTLSVAQPLSCSAGADQSICVGISTNLSGSAANGTLSYSYTWSPAGTLSNANVANPIATPASTTMYYLSVFDGSSTVVDSMIVTVLPLPNLATGSNSPVCNGQTLNITSSNNATSPSYSWSGPSGFTDFSQNPNVATTLAMAGTYTLTLTDVATGCVNTSTTNAVITPLPVATASGNTPLCVGQTLNLTGGFVAGATYQWNGPNTYFSAAQNPTITNVTTAINGVYSLTVTASGCQSFPAATVTVTVNAAPTLTVNNASICGGGSATLTAAGATTYSWNTGPTSPSISVSPTVNTLYYVTGTTGGCSAVDSGLVSILPNTNITGHLNYSLGNVTSGNVFLIAQGLSSALFDTISTVTPNGTGDYTFASIAAGNYYVRIESSLLPSLVNTYYGDVYLWDSALIVNHGCGGNDVANITMIEPPAISGPGSISGTVYEGVGFGLKMIQGSNPVPYTNVIPGVPVKVGKNPSGSLVASGTTDAGGVFTFNNLPIDNYTIYVDIPGYPMDSSYSVSITASTTTANNLDYVVDSNSVYIDLTLSSHSAAVQTNFSLKAFPNPAKESATILFDVTENSFVNFELYNLVGEKIAVILNKNFEKGNYTQTINFDQYALTNGTYMIKANINNNNSFIKLVVIK